MTKRLRMIALLLVLVLCMGACTQYESEIERLGLDKKFGFSLPENGTMLFDSFIPIGFNFREYAVVKYTDMNTFNNSNYEWRALSEENVVEINKALEYHNEMLISDNEPPIPEQYLPDYAKVKGVRLVDPPNKDGFVNKRKFAYVLLDTEKLYAYIVIYCP